MRAREVGGYEPDEREQTELIQLYCVARTALCGVRDAFGKPLDTRNGRVRYAIDRFLIAHGGEPNVDHKWIYCWATENLGVFVQPGGAT